MIYEELPALTRDQINELLNSKDSEKIQRALLSATLNSSTEAWTEDLVVSFLDHDESTIRRVALTCIGHLARLRRRIPEKESIQAIRIAMVDPDPYVQGTAADTLDDIEMFIPVVGKRIRKAISK